MCGLTERIGELRLASRNTAMGFLGQLVAYGWLDRHACASDNRMKLVCPSRRLVAAMDDWLDTVILGLAAERASLRGIGLGYPEVARALLALRAYREPPPQLRQLFAMRGGWLLMNDIIAQLKPVVFGAGPFVVEGFSAGQCAQRLGLSRTTVYRFIHAAAEAGVMSMSRERGAGLAVEAAGLRAYQGWLLVLRRAMTAGLGDSAPQISAVEHSAPQVDHSGAVRGPAICVG